MIEISSVFNYNSDLSFDKAFGLLDLAYNSFYHGINWVYTYSETMFIYDFNINYNLFSNNLYQDNFDFNYYSMWYATLDISYYTLFWSVLLDNLINLNLLKFDFLDSWFKSIITSSEFSLLLFNMPEYVFIANSFLKYFILPFSSNLDFLIVSMNDYENILNPVILAPHLIVYWVFIFYFSFLFFVYYNSSTKEENLIDHDYLIANTTVEAEEEVGAIDDILFGASIIILVFFWYFYINVYFILMDVPELVLAIYLFPFLFYLVLFIPTNLAFDFGLYFVCYLRGVGKAPSSLEEAMYDYLSFAIFYIRLIVQNVRLILMLFTFYSFQHLVTEHGLEKKWIMGDESFIDDLTNSITTPSGLCYFLLFKFSGHIIYFFYELFHLFFVVTAQIIAFNAITFWLFLFLYTMFSSELHEKFFSSKRVLRKDLLKNYSFLKNSVFKK